MCSRELASGRPRASPLELRRGYQLLVRRPLTSRLIALLLGASLLGASRAIGVLIVGEVCASLRPVEPLDGHLVDRLPQIHWPVRRLITIVMVRALAGQIAVGLSHIVVNLLEVNRVLVLVDH